jgi:beta-galactosidase
MPNDWAKGLDDLHAALPGKCIGISEYGAGASIFQHELKATKPKTGGPWHPEEWQSLVHESAWRAIEPRPWLWGTFVWNMFDFAADARSEGDQPGRNDKGLVTYDRKTKKDAFYFYKANWSDEPFVHITGRRMNVRLIGQAQLKVYSNCDTVELFLDSHSLGRMRSDDHIFTWGDVGLREGRHELRAIGEKTGHHYPDECIVTASAGASTRSPATRE